MTWTVTDFSHANHNPIAVVNGQGGTATLAIDVAAGESVTLDASGSSDPDEGQRLQFHWLHYAEAGSADGNLAALTMRDWDSPKLTIHVDAPCRPLWLPLIPCKGSGTAHVILMVTDNGTPHLTSYRRVILHVHALAVNQ